MLEAASIAASIDRSGGAGNLRLEDEQQGIKRKVCELVDLLKVCSKARDLEQGRAIHAEAIECAIDSDIFLGSSLVYMYAKCGSMVDAHRAFDKMEAHDVVTWTSLILGYAENGKGNSALNRLSRMVQEGCQPNPRTFVAGFKACSTLAEQEQGQEMQLESEGRVMVKVQSLERGMALHSKAMEHKCDLNIFVSNTLVDMYAKCGSIGDAKTVFERMPCCSVVSWSALILGYVENGEASVALDLFCLMQREGFAPNSQTFVAALKACTRLAVKEVDSQLGDAFVKLKSLEKGMAIHYQALKSSSNCFVMNTLIDMYASCGSLCDAHRVFETMPSHTAVSWNALILAYAENGDAEQALKLFSGMILYQRCSPNVLTFAAALKACAVAATLEAGKFVHADICKRGFGSETILQASLLDVYGKSGSMLNAQLLFESFSAGRDVISWNALMGGYSRQGDSHQTFELFQGLQDEGLQPDNATFLCLLAACSHAGLIDKGRRYFHVMRSQFGLTPGYEQYVCMVDLLGRANELEEALGVLRSMPVEPDVAAWRTLLAACEKWKNETVGQIAFEYSMRLGDKNAAAYTLMASIYESKNRRALEKL